MQGHNAPTELYDACEHRRRFFLCIGNAVRAMLMTDVISMRYFAERV